MYHYTKADGMKLIIKNPVLKKIIFNIFIMALFERNVLF